eukprot:6570998-Pyramimonas_sp.AAC.1
MDVLRIYQGGYVHGVLLPAKTLLDSLTQIIRACVIVVAHEHVHGHTAHPWNECVDTLARLYAMRVLPDFIEPAWRSLLHQDPHQKALPWIWLLFSDPSTRQAYPPNHGTPLPTPQ